MNMKHEILLSGEATLPCFQAPSIETDSGRPISAKVQKNIKMSKKTAKFRPKSLNLKKKTVHFGPIYEDFFSNLIGN